MRTIVQITLACLPFFASACAATSPTPTVDRPSGAFARVPALYALNYMTGTLEYWPISRSGGNAHTIARKLVVGVGSLVADGSTLYLTSQRPSQVVAYDVASKHERIIPDPNGTPLDIAIDKAGSLYVTNGPQTPNVTVFPRGSSAPEKLTCGLLQQAYGAVVDNESNIYVVGLGAHNQQGIYEIPNPESAGPEACMKLHLRRAANAVSGLTVDPKTDELIVMDNPDFCAGGNEGRLSIYAKPYETTKPRTRILGGNCPGGIHLDATSSTIFFGDDTVSGAATFIRQSTYPGARALGIYSGRQPGPFTTIPSALPN